MAMEDGSMTGTVRSKGRRDMDELFVAGVKVAGALTISPQTDTSYTFVLTDGGATYTRFTNGSSVAATVPTNASVPFPIGSQITFEQGGAGQVTVAGDMGVTVNGTPTLKTSAQYAVAVLIKVDTNSWTLTGNLATS